MSYLIKNSGRSQNYQLPAQLPQIIPRPRQISANHPKAEAGRFTKFMD